MATFSIGAAWDKMTGFVRRESGLLVPVSMATFGLAAVLFSFAMPEGVDPVSAKVSGGQVLLIIPVMLLLALGNMAVTILALTPGTSVAEALRRAVVRLPILVGAAFILGFAMCVALLIVTIIIAPFAGTGVAAAAIILPFAFLLVLVFAVPMLLLSPVIAMEETSPITSLRRVIELARGNISRLFISVSVVTMVTMLISLIATVVIGALAKLLALAIGQPMLVGLIGDIILAGISALLSMANAAYIAFAYRQIAG